MGLPPSVYLDGLARRRGGRGSAPSTNILLTHLPRNRVRIENETGRQSRTCINQSTFKDEKGNVASISTYDVYQSNGVIHVVDNVLMPR